MSKQPIPLLPTPSLSLIKDPSLNALLMRRGFVIIPCLSPEAVQKLRTYFLHTHPTSPNAFYSSSFEVNPELKSQVNNLAKETLGTWLDQNLYEHKCLGSSFLLKPPGTSGIMPPHQDWTIVDESIFSAFTLWIALDPTDAEHGAMQVIPGSHRFSPAIRTPSLPWPFQSISHRISEDLINLPMKAGEGLLFHHSLIHASCLHHGNEGRLALAYGLAPVDASLHFFHHQQDGLHQYVVDDSFFMNYNTQIGDAPTHYISKRPVSVEPIQMSEEAYQFSKHCFETENVSENYRMKPIFKHPEHQASFEKDGFLVLPLLQAEEVEALSSYYHSLQLKDERGFGFHVSMDHKNKQLCREVRDYIWSVGLPALDRLLMNYKPFVASFVVKEVNPKGVVPAHQDWSFADQEEAGFASITCWIALVDTHLDNGGMGVIKGSHRIMQNHRPSPSPQTPVPLSEHMYSIFPYLHTIDMKAGEVLFFDNRTFHASPPNTSHQLRLAAGIGITHADAKLVHYFLKPDGTHKTMLKYFVDTDFFLQYDNATLSECYDSGKIPEGYGTPEEVPYEFPKYTSAEWIRFIQDKGNVFNQPMVEKLALLFGQSSEQASVQEETRIEETPQEIQIPVATSEVWIDDRSFFQKYTPLNIAREIKKRLIGT